MASDLKLTVHAPMKLLTFLKESCEGVSVKAIKRAIDQGQCTVNGKLERFSTYHLRKGDRVEIHLSQKEGEKKPSILFEDEELLICDKPPGFLSVNTAFNRSFPQYKNRLALVHRLDKDTTGVIVLAKTAKMRQAMEALFKERTIRKRYLAIVIGEVPEKIGKMESFLTKKGESGGMPIWGSCQNKAGEHAVTHWKVIQTSKGASLLDLEPLTGRTHQLRVHLSEKGFPILGDILYSTKTFPLIVPRQLLHAYQITFQHPITEQKLTVTAPLPQDFRDVLSHLHFNASSIKN